MKFFKNFSVYVLNSILNAAIPFLLLPVLTAYLTTEEYGTLTNVQVFITFTTPFILLGIHGAVNTAYFRMEKEKFPAYLSSALTLSFIAMIAIALFFIATSAFFSQQLEIPAFWLLVIPFICFFQTVTQVVLILFQARSKPFGYGIYQISMTLLNLLLSVLFVVGLKWSWEGRLYGILASYFVFFVAGIIILYRSGFLSGKINKPDIRDVLLFGMPLIPHMISGPVIQVLDRFFLTHFLGKDAVGLYTVGYQIGIAVAFVTFPFNQTWIPYLYPKLKNIDENGKRKLVIQSYIFMFSFLCLAFALYLVSPFIFDIFINSKFHDAQVYVLPVALGSAFGGMYYIAANFIFYEKKTRSIAMATLSSAVLSILLNISLIPKFGAMGAAITFLVSNFFNFIIVWLLSNRIFPMPWFFFLKK